MSGFILLSALAIPLSGILPERELYKLSRQRTEDELASATRLILQHANDTFNITDTTLLSLRRLLETDWARADGSALAAELLKDGDINPNLRNISIIGRDGTRLSGLGSHIPKSDSAYDASSDKAFAFHQSSTSRDLRFGVPQISPVDDNLVLPLSRRVNDADGQFAGVVVAYINLRHFANFYSRLNQKPDFTVAIFSTEGDMLVLYPNTERFRTERYRLSGIAARRIMTEDRFIYTFPSPIDGTRRIAALEKSGTRPFVVISARAEAIAEQEWTASVGPRTSVRLFAGIGFGVAGFVMLWQIRRRQMTANALLQKQTEFQALAEGSGDAVLRLNGAGVIDYASPASFVILGQSVATLTGLRLAALCREEERAAFQACFDATLAGAEGRISFTLTGAGIATGGQIRRVTATLRLADSSSERMVIAVVRDETEGYLAEQRLISMVSTDPLTGLANRRRFAEALDKEWRRALRDYLPVSLLFIDIDHFKAFNDTYGHQAGDQCIKAIADRLAASIRRPGDLAARYGGEEFVLLLPNTEAAGARDLAERIRRSIEALSIAHQGASETAVVTVSIGVATERPSQQLRKSESLITFADRALYEAKEDGRNRVCVHGETSDPFDVDWSGETDDPAASDPTGPDELDPIERQRLKS